MRNTSGSTKTIKESLIVKSGSRGLNSFNNNFAPNCWSGVLILSLAGTQLVRCLWPTQSMKNMTESLNVRTSFLSVNGRETKGVAREIDRKEKTPDHTTVPVQWLYIFFRWNSKREYFLCGFAWILHCDVRYERMCLRLVEHVVCGCLNPKIPCWELFRVNKIAIVRYEVEKRFAVGHCQNYSSTWGR